MPDEGTRDWIVSGWRFGFHVRIGKAFFQKGFPTDWVLGLSFSRKNHLWASLNLWETSFIIVF